MLNPDDCENFANGIRCIYQNKTCIERSTTNTLRQPFISLIKGDSQRTFQYGCKDSEPIRSVRIFELIHNIPQLYFSEILVSCGGIKDCVNCVARKNCGWCDGIQTCLNSDAACADDALLTDKNKCPFGKMQKMPQRLRPCNLATNCYSCRQLKHCSWFSIDTRNSCVSLENEGMQLFLYVLPNDQ